MPFQLNRFAKPFIPQSFKNCVPSFLLDDNVDLHFKPLVIRNLNHPLVY